MTSPHDRRRPSPALLPILATVTVSVVTINFGPIVGLVSAVVAGSVSSVMIREAIR